MSKKKVDNSKELGEELLAEHKRWKNLYEHGGSDPFWADGVNLNLVRNHILWYRKRIADELDPSKYPECFTWDVPPEVPMQYMANPDRIIKLASETLEIIERHPDYRYLKNYRSLNGVTDKETDQLLSVLCTVESLHEFIERRELVSARRFMQPDNLLQRIKGARSKLEERKNESRELPLGQLTIFDFM